MIVSSFAYKFIKRASNKRQKDYANMGVGVLLTHVQSCWRVYVRVSVTANAYMCVCVCKFAALVDVWGRDNSYTSLYKAISCEPIKRAGWSGRENCFRPDARCFNLQLFISLGSKKEQAD